MPPWGLSHVAFIILLFPAGLEDKLGVDASWHGAHSASWSLALSYPRFGAPRCSFSFGRIVVCPEGKRVSAGRGRDRKSTRLNSSHGYISYAVFCLKKKKKLMNALAQCYNVISQLDINNTIDHRPEGDAKWFLENEKTVTQFCRKLAAERPLKDIRDEYNYHKNKGMKDDCSRLLFFFFNKSPTAFAIHLSMNATLQA